MKDILNELNIQDIGVYTGPINGEAYWNSAVYGVPGALLSYFYFFRLFTGTDL